MAAHGAALGRRRAADHHLSAHGSYPLAVTWSSLLLAIAPAPLAAVAAFAPARIGLAAAVAGVVILVAGMAGGIGLVGVFFIPAAVVLAVAAVKLWREQP